MDRMHVGDNKPHPSALARASLTCLRRRQSHSDWRSKQRVACRCGLRRKYPRPFRRVQRQNAGLHSRTHASVLPGGGGQSSRVTNPKETTTLLSCVASLWLKRRMRITLAAPVGTCLCTATSAPDVVVLHVAMTEYPVVTITAPLR